MAVNHNKTWEWNHAAQPSIPPTQPPLGQPWSPPAGPSPPTGPPKPPPRPVTPPTYTHNYDTRFKKRGGVPPSNRGRTMTNGPVNKTTGSLYATRSQSAPPRIRTKKGGKKRKSGKKTRRNR